MIRLLPALLLWSCAKDPAPKAPVDKKAAAATSASSAAGGGGSPASGAAGAGGPAPLQPGPVPASPLPLTAQLSWGGPPIEGSNEELELKTLTRSYETLNIQADIGPIGRVTDAAGLLDALAGDPRWRVGMEEGVTKAVLRAKSGEAWTTAMNGYHKEGERVWHVGLRFGPRPSSSRWSSGAVVRPKPTDKVISVRTQKLRAEPYMGHESLTVVSEGSVVALELQEVEPRLTLKTVEALAVEVLPWVETVRMGGARGLLPRGEPATGQSPRVWRAESPGGTIELQGRLNPEAPGWTWLRVMEPSGQPWQEVPVAVATLERIGWSKSPYELWWMQGRLTLPLPLPAGARVEAWFLADNGGPPRSLGVWSI